MRVVYLDEYLKREGLVLLDTTGVELVHQQDLELEKGSNEASV